MRQDGAAAASTMLGLLDGDLLHPGIRGQHLRSRDAISAA
jgi:hypothetical protein